MAGVSTFSINKGRSLVIVVGVELIGCFCTWNAGQSIGESVVVINGEDDFEHHSCSSWTGVSSCSFLPLQWRLSSGISTEVNFESISGTTE